jgi:Arc/MetJ-type ribon-helix-helix transcriptional regulator
MTTKLTISVPDEIAAFLRDTGNASGAVTAAVRPLLPEARRERQRAAARAMAEHLRSRTPGQIAEDGALIEASNDIALADSQW